jgi:hypothetical protein
MHIADALKEKGYEVDRRRVHLPEPIKETGDFTVTCACTARSTSKSPSPSRARAARRPPARRRASPLSRRGDRLGRARHGGRRREAAAVRPNKCNGGLGTPSDEQEAFTSSNFDE